MKKFIKVLALALFLLCGIGATNATKQSKVIVTNRDCTNYLLAHGYTSPVVLQIMQDGSRLCDTSNPYHTMVYVSGESIVGMEDMGQE